MGVLESLLAIDLSVADRDAVISSLGESRRARNRLDAFDVAAARRLAELSAVSPSLYPERMVADAARVSLGQASKGFERAKTVERVPELGVVLGSGETSGAHVDVVTRTMRDLNPQQRDRLTGRGEVLARAAGTLSCDEFARVVRNEVRRVCADDGLARLERQRRNTRLRSWVDRDSGMWCLRGEFDPETGLRLDRQLRAQLESLFHDSTPDTCPADPLAKQDHLRALALVGLCNGQGGRTSTEITVLIDAKTLYDGEHDDTSIDFGLDVDLPVETVRRMACCAEVIVPVVTAANGVNVHLGRQRREPNKAQRRALRAIYRCCAIPGCTIGFDRGEVHHWRWWRHGGPTDIENLVPLCFKHHHAVHEGGWQLTLDEHRNLTITHPDGTTMTTGPPKCRAG